MNVPRPDPPTRDNALDAAWKAHSTELPPARVDAAILAAAHREARSRPHAAGDEDAGARARGPSRAWWGLAAAATIGAIAFGIVQIAPEPATETPPSVASDTPSVATEAPAPPPAPVTERKADPAPVAQDKVAAEPPARAAAKPAAPRSAPREQPRAERPLSVVTPRPFPGTTQPLPAAPPAEQPVKREAESAPTLAPDPSPARGRGEASAARADEQQQRAADSLTRQRSAAKLAASAPKGAELREPAGAAPLRDERAPRTPAAWIDAIREHYAAQRFAEAARELNAFRAAYADADARLPESLRIWAATVKPD